MSAIGILLVHIVQLDYIPSFFFCFFYVPDASSRAPVMGLAKRVGILEMVIR